MVRSAPAGRRVTALERYFAAHPELATLFNNAMSSMARLVNSATLDSYDLSDVDTLVDVGGGKGTLVATLLDRYPGMRAVVFEGLEDVGERLVEAGYALVLEGAAKGGHRAGMDGHVRTVHARGQLRADRARAVTNNRRLAGR